VNERPLEVWPDALERACADTTHFRQVRVLRETASTQDAADEGGLPVGSLVTAGRQSAGRGRLGHGWADTADDGIAVTFVVQRQDPERLAMAAAVAVAQAARDSVPVSEAARLGLKWPNDLLCAWPGGAPRKVAGVLVEAREARALIGIGVNVRQRAFAGELADRAASLHMIGGVQDRLHALLALVQRLDVALSATSASLEADYGALDRTAGLRMRFNTPQGLVEGVVLHCDPSRGLRVRTDAGEQWLAAATTRVQPDPPASRSTLQPPCVDSPASPRS